jgi:hypothetical protein
MLLGERRVVLLVYIYVSECKLCAVSCVQYVVCGTLCHYYYLLLFVIYLLLDLCFIKFSLCLFSGFVFSFYFVYSVLLYCFVYYLSFCI